MLARRLPLLLAVLLIAALFAVDSPNPVPAQVKKDDPKVGKKEAPNDLLGLLDKSLPKLPKDGSEPPRGPESRDRVVQDGGMGDGGSGPPQRGKIRFIRLRHSDKGWDKNFGIGGDRNLLAEYVAREPRLRGKVADETEAIDIAALGAFPAMKGPPMVYVGGTHIFAPSVADKKVLRQYLTERHGMILGDNLGGKEFHDSFVNVMNVLTGTTPVAIPRYDRIHQRPYELAQIPIVVAHGGKDALGWKIDGRWAVYYHPGALSDAWRDDHAGVKKEIWELSYQLGINLIYYSHREYAIWLRNVPERKPSDEIFQVPPPLSDIEFQKSTIPLAKKDNMGEPKKAKRKTNPFDEKDDLLNDAKSPGLPPKK